MSSSAFNYSPTFHRPESMREGFVWWRKISSSFTSRQLKIRGICFVTARLNNFRINPDLLAWHVKDKSTTQISKVRRLS
jgi:hypothetical protein